MRCAECIRWFLFNNPDKTMLEAVLYADDARAVIGGQSYCTRHLEDVIPKLST